MVFSKHILIILTTLSLLASAQASAAPVEDNNLAPGPIANNNVNQNTIDFNSLWNDPVAAQSTMNAFEQAALDNRTALASAVAAAANAGGANRLALDTAIARFRTQQTNLDALATRYTEGAALAREIATLTAQASQLPPGAELDGVQARLTLRQQSLSEIETAMGTSATNYASTQTIIDSEESALNTVIASVNHTTGRPDDTARRTAATEAKADADALLADASTARAAVIASIRATGVGDGGSSTKITEGRSSRIASSSRRMIGYTLDM